MSLIEQLKRHEGISLTVYQCSANKLTIGYGRNLEDNGITEKEAELLLINDLKKVHIELKARLDIYSSWRLSKARKAVLQNMAFNLGISGLLKFKKMLQAVEQRDYELAAIEMMDSSWAKQVGRRATELAEQMRTGRWQ